MKLRFHLVLLAACMFYFGSARYLGAAPTVVVFDSFGAGNSYNTSVAWGVSGAGTSGGYRGQAEWFVPTASGNLSASTLAMFQQGGTGRVNYFLAQDNGSGIPGTILENYNNTLTPTGLLTLNSSSHPFLQAGLTYWLCTEPADSTTSNAWFENNQGRALGFAFERSQWGWSAVNNPASNPNSGVFRISVTPVPEPSTCVLVALGFYLLTTKRFNSALRSVS
jgi:hypothetical protein